MANTNKENKPVEETPALTADEIAEKAKAEAEATKAAEATATPTPEEITAAAAKEAEEAKATETAKAEAEAAALKEAAEKVVAEAEAEAAKLVADALAAATEEEEARIAEEEATEAAGSAMAGDAPTGLSFKVSNFRITKNVRQSDGSMKELYWNDGDIMIDDGGPNSLDHSNIASLLADGYIKLVSEE